MAFTQISPPTVSTDPAAAGVTMAWDPSLEPVITGYYVAWGLLSGQCTNLVDVGNQTSVVINGFTPSVTYFFTVLAYDAAGVQAPPANEIQYLEPAEVPASPMIVSDLTNCLVTAGEDITLRVDAVGSAPLTFSWQFNGARLMGATNATLTLGRVASSQAGVYQVIASNAAGTVSSSPANVAVFQRGLLVVVQNGPLLDLTFGGLPLQAYRVEYAGAPNGPWQTLSTTVSDQNGILVYAADMHKSAGFYRILSP